MKSSSYSTTVTPWLRSLAFSRALAIEADICARRLEATMRARSLSTAIEHSRVAGWESAAMLYAWLKKA